MKFTFHLKYITYSHMEEFYLFACCLFNDAVNSSGYIEYNDNTL
jgi:hypothetical protein